MLADPKPVAAIVSEYRQNSHADLIVGRILEGYDFDGKARPELKLASLYTDQRPSNDWSRALARKHDVPIYDNIPGAVKLGTDKVPIAGVISIGDSGDYPTNEKGQRLYPQRRFFEQVTDVFEKCGCSVPVFNDKHLASSWDDAKWMYDRARALNVPLMAGSALPLTSRQPPLNLPMDCRMSEAVAVGYGELPSAGFHALEMLQCMVERRRGAECGVREVRYMQGSAVWRAERRDEWSEKLMDEALDACPKTMPGSPQRNSGDAAVGFLIDYCDGLRGTVLLLNGHAQHFAFAARMRRVYRVPGIKGTIAACQFRLQTERPFGHFTHLVRSIERMVQSRHADYPVERTLLTTGILDAVMTSRHEGHRPVRTPHLQFHYDPVDYPFARDGIPS